MSIAIRLWVIAVIVFSCLLGSSPVLAQTPTPTPSPVKRLQNVVWIWLENTPAATMNNLRSLKNIWQNYPSVRFTRYYPVSAVTQSNVVAMIAGSDLGIPDNSLTRITAPTIVDLLEAKNIPWRAYAEDFPGACYPGEGAVSYKRYRFPFISVARVQSDRYLCSKIVSFAALTNDLRMNNLPRFSVVVPNLKNSGATTTIYDAEAKLRSIIDPILSVPERIADTTIIITTTNNTDARRPEMFMMMIGYGIAAPAMTNTSPYHHYHLLRTIEESLSLGHLNQNDATVDPILGFWN